MDPTETINRQLDFYNAHDLDGFCSTYADGIVIATLGTGTVLVDGRDALRERYAARFSVPGLRAEILRRIVEGDYVTDHERILVDGEEPSRAVVTYRVRDGKIDRVWMARD